MISFKQFLDESAAAQAKLAQLRAKKQPKQRTLITKQQLGALERHLDQLFRDLGIDIEFTKHFFERLRDARNKKDITIEELNDIFTKAHNRYGSLLKGKPEDWQAVLKSISTKINIPFVIKIEKNGMIALVSKTVMRKQNFQTPNQELKVS